MPILLFIFQCVPVPAPAVYYVDMPEVFLTKCLDVSVGNNYLVTKAWVVGVANYLVTKRIESGSSHNKMCYMHYKARLCYAS